jgi:hypothetical protein
MMKLERYNAMTKLTEGLRLLDLQGVVQNTISIDEFQSKIDETAIVIAFYVSERKAADDLNRFLQKAAIDLLDTDVSAAPDQRGNYLVFMELPMNDKIAKAVANVCADLKSLTGHATWVVKVRGSDESKPLDPNEVEAVVRSSLRLSLGEFFSKSDLNTVRLVEGYWCASSPSHQIVFNVADFGSFEHVVKRNKLYEAAVDLSPRAQRICKHIRSLLGSSWAVEQLGERLALYHDASNALMLIEFHEG